MDNTELEDLDLALRILHVNSNPASSLIVGRAMDRGYTGNMQTLHPLKSTDDACLWAELENVSLTITNCFGDSSDLPHWLVVASIRPKKDTTAEARAENRPEAICKAVCATLLLDKNTKKGVQMGLGI